MRRAFALLLAAVVGCSGEQPVPKPAAQNPPTVKPPPKPAPTHQGPTDAEKAAAKRKQLASAMVAEAAKSLHARATERWGLAVGLLEKVVVVQEIERKRREQAASEQWTRMNADDRARTEDIRQRLRKGHEIDDEDMQFALRVFVLRDDLLKNGAYRATKLGYFDKIKALAKAPTKVEWMRGEFGLLADFDQALCLSAAKRLAAKQPLNDRDEQRLAGIVRLLNNFLRDDPEQGPASRADPKQLEEYRRRRDAQVAALKWAVDHGREKQAELRDVLEKAVRRDAEFVEGLILLAVTLAAAEDERVEALAVSGRALALRQEDPWALLARGIARTRSGSEAAGRADVQRATQLHGPISRFKDLCQ